jgi:8-oxo-dGTP pyrophosphatase MutT (NUDIX family)
VEHNDINFDFNEFVEILPRVKQALYPDYLRPRRAAVFLIFYHELSPGILAIHKKDIPGYPWRNQIALPGGHIESKDPSAKQAAYREVKEELGIDSDDLVYKASLGHFPTINNIDIEVIMGFLKIKVKLVPDPREIQRIIKIPWFELRRIHYQNGFSKTIPTLQKLTYSIASDDGGYTIWGVTARILHYLLEQLRLHGF